MKQRSFDGLGGRRPQTLPHDCRIKRRTLTGYHRPGDDGDCVTCGWPFPVSTCVISGETPVSGKIMKEEPEAPK